jgi:uncharacterized repeat protein (TIGR02543 family)
MNQAALVKTTDNRYFTWGISDFALLLFQPINTTLSSPFNITDELLAVIGADQAIVEFKPDTFGNVMKFRTSNGDWYDYGDYRYIFLPTLSERPTYEGASFYGDSTAFNISQRLVLEPNEEALFIVGPGMITNQNRLYYTQQTGLNYSVEVSDLSGRLGLDETIVDALGDVSRSFFITSRGRIYTNDSSSSATSWNDVTSTYLTAVQLAVQALPYQSSIDYVPTRANYVFLGWYTNPSLVTPFTGTVPLNNNLVLYGRFVASVG